MTHSVSMLPIWALLLSMAFAWLWRGRYPWREFYAVSAIGIAFISWAILSPPTAP